MKSIAYEAAKSAAIFILSEWLFWWLLPKNNFAHGGKTRPRCHRHSPKVKYFAFSPAAIKTAGDGARQRTFAAHMPSGRRSAATAEEAAGCRIRSRANAFPSVRREAVDLGHSLHSTLE